LPGNESAGREGIAVTMEIRLEGRARQKVVRAGGLCKHAFARSLMDAPRISICSRSKYIESAK
jgi:hypothetical protein